MTDPRSEGPASPARPTAWERTQDAVAVIGRQARDSNLSRVNELDKLVSLAPDGQLSEEDQRRGQRLAHAILGSAGTFGFAAVTEPARRLDRLFASQVGTREFAAVKVLLDRVRVALVLEPSQDDD